jgi:hypothetical protein
MKDQATEKNDREYEYDHDDICDYLDCNESQPCRGDERDTSLELDLLLLDDEELRMFSEELRTLRAELLANSPDTLPF